jgi:hypothetical protein
MSKRISIYNATYNKRLDEMDRNDVNMAKAQRNYESPKNDGDDPDDFEVAKAVDYLGEYFLEDAIRLGYENINDYAVEELGYDNNMQEPGIQLIEDSIPLYFKNEL